jgi:hypothetical protein
MIRTAAVNRKRAAGVIGALLALSASGGCGQAHTSPVRIANATLGPLIVAVAPALNFSGSSDFDRSAVADIMASELGSVVGVEVVPVSRVLAVLSEQGRDEIASPAHAQDVMERLGTDAILVFAVTEYEPYDPPIVGITAQLYGSRRRASSGGVDPVRLSREASAPAVETVSASFGPLAQAEEVFDASHGITEERVKEFAGRRDATGSPFEWRLYMKSQRHFMRYCCHQTLRTLFGGGTDMALAAGGSGNGENAATVRYDHAREGHGVDE